MARHEIQSTVLSDLALPIYLLLCPHRRFIFRYGCLLATRRHLSFVGAGTGHAGRAYAQQSGRIHRTAA